MSDDEKRKALDRIVKLVNLAAKNPSEEEARGAAMRACRMIVEHDVVLRIPGGPSVSVELPPPPTLPSSEGVLLDDFMRMRDELHRDIKHWESLYWDALTGRRR